MAAKVTSRRDRSTPEEIGIAMIRGTGMPFAEVDLDDHVAAVTVYGSTKEEADSRAKRLADGWNMQAKVYKDKETE